MLRLRDQIEAVGDLAIRIPQFFSELVAPRERMNERIFFADRTFAKSRRVAGARVHQRGGVVGRRERFRERDQVLCAERVRIERFVERRVEVDDARDVHDGGDRPANVRDDFFVEPTKRFADVTVDDDDLLAKECFVRIAVSLAQRTKRLARRDRFVEARFARGRRRFSNEQVDAFELGETIKEKARENLPEKSGAAEHDDALARDDRAWVERLARGRRSDE